MTMLQINRIDWACILGVIFCTISAYQAAHAERPVCCPQGGEVMPWFESPLLKIPPMGVWTPAPRLMMNGVDVTGQTICTDVVTTPAVYVFQAAGVPEDTDYCVETVNGQRVVRSTLVDQIEYLWQGTDGATSSTLTITEVPAPGQCQIYNVAFSASDGLGPGSEICTVADGAPATAGASIQVCEWQATKVCWLIRGCGFEGPPPYSYPVTVLSEARAFNQYTHPCGLSAVGRTVGEYTETSGQLRLISSSRRTILRVIPIGEVRNTPETVAQVTASAMAAFLGCSEETVGWPDSHKMQIHFGPTLISIFDEIDDDDFPIIGQARASTLQYLHIDHRIVGGPFSVSREVAFIIQRFSIGHYSIPDIIECRPY